MKTFHVGGMNLLRRYATLEAALKEAKDDDTIEIHKDLTFSGTVPNNVIINGNGHILTVENGNVGLDCKMPVVISDLTIVTEPRANGMILWHGGRLENVKTKIKGPARVLYPTIMVKAGTLIMNQCDIMRFSGEEQSQITITNSIFRDYYGAVCYLRGHENLSYFFGDVTLEHCHLDCCFFLSTAELISCDIGAFNRSCGSVTMTNCKLMPTINKPAVNFAKEPADGPLEKKNETSKFAWEQETGELIVSEYTSDIPNEFVGFHILSGSLMIDNTNNPDEKGYHIIRRGSLSFHNTTDASFYEMDNSTLSVVRSTVNTSIKNKTAMEQLESLIGLGPVKRTIQSILNTVTMNAKTDNKDFQFSYHMIFAGDPGTGKTTVAKIVAQALFEIGAIPENKCTEVAADSLVKGYVGQTAQHVRQVLDDALGGVLFIDEAYELTARENSFNSEVLSVLIRYMEEHRDELVVIAAGYEREMNEFLASNVGLTRRFQWISFPDYTAKEMAEIFELIRETYQEIYENDKLKELLPKLFEQLTGLYKRKPDAYGRITNGGNAGLVRNVFQQVILAKNNRVIEDINQELFITKDDLLTGFRQEMEKAVQV